MSDNTPVPAPEGVVTTSPQKDSLLRLLFRDPVGATALIFIALVVLASALAPLLASADPNYAPITQALCAPGGEHLLGCDSSGRDVFARLLYGGRFSLGSAALALAVALLIGAISGLIAGYFGKLFDGVASWVANILLALPGMVVLLAARAVVGPSAWTSMAIFGVLLSASVFRLVRATVQGVRGELYIDAARVSGLTDMRIIFRHVLRVVRAPLIIQSAGIASVAIAIQAGLEFMGFGDMNVPTWGSMLNDGFQKIYQAPLLVLWPALMIALVCLSLSLIANSLRDALEGAGGASRKQRRAAKGLVRQSRDGEATQYNAAPIENTAVPADALLKVENLKIGYVMRDGSIKEIVHGVNLHVSRGEVLGLVGESGSGKTQTAFGVMKLLPEGGRILEGTVTFDGVDLASKSEKTMTKIRGKQIAYIPQEPMSNLDPCFTIGSQLVEPMVTHLGISKQEAKEKSLGLLARVGIRQPERVFNSYPHEVSGGMAQRVLIAGAISCEPDLLIADEPTTALDVTVQADILDLLRSLQAEFNMGVLIVTHNFGVVADICDRVAVMQQGLIVEEGTALSLFQAPEHPYTQQLFAAILDESTIRPEYVEAIR